MTRKLAGVALLVSMVVAGSGELALAQGNGGSPAVRPALKRMLTLVSDAVTPAPSVAPAISAPVPTMMQPKMQPYFNPDHGHDHDIEPPRLGIYGRIRPGRGMQVVDVMPHTVAARMGLEPGDVIVRINEFRIDCHHTYNEALIDAVLYHDGVIRVVVDNVRARHFGHGQRFVTATAVLPTYDQPIEAYAAEAPAAYN